MTTSPPPLKYAILRATKLKSSAEVLKSFKHAFRELPTPNADPAKLGDNTNIGANSSAEAVAAFEARLPAKVRADSVLVIEYLFAASPETFKGKTRAQQDAYFDDALAWVRARHGAENIVCAGIHRDETGGNHMYAFAVPRDPVTGRLNAKRWLGGTKLLRQMQTEFADQVGKPHGLERGIEGSKARHTTVQQFYGTVDAVEKALAIPAEEYEPKVLKRSVFGNTVEDGAEIKARIEKLWSPVAMSAATAVLDRRRANEMRRTAQASQKEVKRLQERLKASEQDLERFTGGLASDQVGTILQMADVFRMGNIAEAEKARRVAALPLLLVNRAGAVATFAQQGIEAIKRAGEWQRVNWKAVEKAAIAEAVNENGQPERKATADVWKVSPGRVDMSLEAIEHRTAELSDKSLDRGSSHDNDHSPSRGR
jgi:hypothetical protein